MAFKVNYGQRRNERRRAQLAKQEKKEQERREAVALRKAARAAGEQAPALPGEPALPTEKDDHA